MSGRVLIVKNIEREGPGLLRDVLSANDVEADYVQVDRGDALPALDAYAAVFVLGGPASANDSAMQSQVAMVRRLLDSGMPYLGICLGHQVLALAAGAEVVAASRAEVGLFHDDSPYEVTLTASGSYDPLFADVAPTFPVFQLHGEEVRAGDAVEVLAVGAGSEVQAIRAGRRAYGLQMHIELTPDMLDVWCRQDEMLQSVDLLELRRQFEEIKPNYDEIGKQVLTNFLVLAGIASSVELHLDNADVRY